MNGNLPDFQNQTQKSAIVAASANAATPVTLDIPAASANAATPVTPDTPAAPVISGISGTQDTGALDYGQPDRLAMNRLLSSIMDIGELLLVHGAEVGRVEDTIRRLCGAYGFARSDVFTITSSIVVTAMFPDGSTLTQTRRIRERDTDLGKVEKVNALSRRICASPVSLENFRKELSKISQAEKPPVWLDLGMYMMISASLSVFFGGTWMDGLAASLSGIVLFAMISGSAALKLNGIIQSMVCSAVTAICVLLLVRAGIGAHPDKITIGNIMLVIPGIQLTNSLRDMISGDMISGLLNMSEALLKAIAVAMGFAIVLLVGGV